MAVDLGYDESGETGGDILIVSMQLGLVKSAKRMKKLWNKHLRKAGIPYFHSQEYGNLSSGVFGGLSRARRAALLEVLGQFVRLRLNIGFTTHINQKEYFKQTDAEFRSKWATPYAFSVALLTLAAQNYLDQKELGYDVNILIEEGHKNVGQAINVIKVFKESPETVNGATTLRIKSYGLGSKKDHPILQAADMLAFSEWQNISGGDKEIYDSLHKTASRYQTYVFDGMEWLDHMKDSARQWEISKKEWGQRKQRSE
jgi:hypothetical protein